MVNLAVLQSARVREMDARLDARLTSVGGYVLVPKRPGPGGVQ